MSGSGSLSGGCELIVVPVGGDPGGAAVGCWVTDQPGVCEDAPPGTSRSEVPGHRSGDRPVTGELTREILSAQQRGVGDGDPDLHATPAAAPPQVQRQPSPLPQ